MCQDCLEKALKKPWWLCLSTAEQVYNQFNQSWAQHKWHRFWKKIKMREKERKVKYKDPKKKGVFKCWAFMRIAAYSAVPLFHVCSELEINK